MKKILFILSLVYFFTPSVLAQKLNTRSITDSMDRLILFFQDTTFKNTESNGLVTTYELTSPESFSIRPTNRDTMTTDSLCESVEILTIQVKMKRYKKAKFVKYQKTKEADEPEIKALLRQRQDIDAEIKRRTEEKKKAKT
jgi:hypothetical protein